MRHENNCPHKDHDLCVSFITDVRHFTVNFKGRSEQALDCEVDVCPMCGAFQLTRNGKAKRNETLISLMERYIKHQETQCDARNGELDLWRVNITKVDLPSGETTKIERFYSSYAIALKEMISAFSFHNYVTSSGSNVTVYTSDTRQCIYHLSPVTVEK